MKRLLLVVLSLMLVVSMLAGCGAAPGVTTTTKASGSSNVPVKIGHLSYHTGPFGHVGPQFDGAANFALDIINENPPLGGEVTIIHQDIGTIGEGQAARKLLDSDKVDVLLNVAGEYMSYRDWMLQYIKTNVTKPLMPSVHAGSISAEYGGNVSEPIFRGAPMDTDQGVVAAIHAKDEGAKTVVVIAIENDGMQMQQDAAVAACETIGLEVLDQIDAEPELTTYRSIMTKAQAKNPDALIIFAAAEDGGTMVKNAAELGMSCVIVGPTDWLFVEFPQTATMSAIEKHKSVTAVGFTYVDGPAWDFYKAAWDGSEYASLNLADNSYTMQYYDLLNIAMLAVKKAGNLEIADWVEAMRSVSMEPGTKVYTYKEGFDALERGEDIDYSGVTGEMNYSETGVVGGAYGVFEWTDTETMVRIETIEGTRVLDVTSK